MPSRTPGFGIMLKGGPSATSKVKNIFSEEEDEGAQSRSNSHNGAAQATKGRNETSNSSEHIDAEEALKREDGDREKTKDSDDDEEDDYMTMLLPDPSTSSTSSKSQPETSLQRRQRLKREAEARSRPKSKAELAAIEAAKREEGLATSLDKANKGFQMMAKLGFKAGGALGKEGDEGRREPIAVDVKLGRGGIGLDEERKRKVRDQVDESVKRVKAEEGEYRERMRSEREEKEREGKIWGAMRVCEKLDEEEDAKQSDGGGSDDDSSRQEEVAGDPVNGVGERSQLEEEGDTTMRKRKSRPLHSIPVLWRALARGRLEKERERRMRYDLQQSLSRLPTYDDPDEDKEYRQAFGKEVEELEEEDPELDEFLSLPSEERLGKLATYLRQHHHYCFWCKYKYPDEKMEGCPGWTEEEHD